jgi:hypothetical protein
MSGERGGHGMSPKTWNNLLEQIAVHVHVAVWWSCKIRHKLLLLMPRMRECCRPEQCGPRSNDSLVLRSFQYAQFLEHHEDSPYTASVSKVTYPQQSPVAWRNRTVPRSIKLLPQATLCPSDGLCFVINTNSLVLCPTRHLPIVTKQVLRWHHLACPCRDVTHLNLHQSEWREFWNVSLDSAPTL